MAVARSKKLKANDPEVEKEISAATKLFDQGKRKQAFNTLVSLLRKEANLRYHYEALLR